MSNAAAGKPAKDSGSTGFKNRLGFLLVSAGCAIGIGNVWKFPYVAGENGGGIFVIFYLFFLAIMGLPVLSMEYAVGRASGTSIVQAYKKLEPAGSKWHIHGWFSVIGCYILMMYYTTVSGWMLAYFVKFLKGEFSEPGLDVKGTFDTMLASPIIMMIFTGVIVIVGFTVCSFDIQSGLERITKIMMAGLLMLIIVLVVNSFTLSGVKEGLSFYLLPSVERVKESGFGNVITAAMNQAFFTLSIGISSMEIFGSYMSKEKSLISESQTVCLLDTFVAVCSGLIIFPACFSYGVVPDAGPSLIFITLPNVFMNMRGGRIWGSFFFLFMTFASFSTVIAVFENIIKATIDNFGISRKKSVGINSLIMIIASLPCVLGYNIWSSLRLIGDRNVLDSEDFIVSNILLPVGALIFTIFCSYKCGWGFDNYAAEANTGDGIKVKPWLKYYYRYILPILILVILVQGLIN